MLERRSVLAGVLTPGVADGAATPVTIGEAAGFALLEAAAFPGTLSELEQIVQRVLGSGLPRQVGVTGGTSDVRIFKVGPEQFWIVAPCGTWSASLHDAVPGEVGSVISLSHGRTRLFIEGMLCREVLAGGIGLDLHPDVFRPDAFALTELQHTPVLLHRVSPDRYELYVPTTFAGWVWDWLTDAALPFGYAVAATPSRMGS